MSLFPYKLHKLLTEIDSNCHLSSIVSWMPSGKAFQIHQPELFEELLLHKYFPRQSQMKSFKRQLQYYGFHNLGDCIFVHPHFLRGQKNMCGEITHTLPTKSQKMGNAATTPRRTLGKREKRALRKSLSKIPAPAPAPAPAPQAVQRTSPEAVLSMAGARAPASFAPNTKSDVQQVLLQRPDNPMHYYWNRISQSARKEASDTASLQASLFRLKNDLISLQANAAASNQKSILPSKFWSIGNELSTTGDHVDMFSTPSPSA